MRAAVMRAVDAPLVVEDVTIAAPGPGEVLIDVASVGLCHSDLKLMEGAFPVVLPAVLGHESAGIVRKVGEGVTEVAPGDHVVTSLSVACGECVFCRTGGSHLCEGRHATRRHGNEPPRLSVAGAAITQCFDLGAFAEQMLVHQSGVVRIDDSVPFAAAALLGCGVATGLGAVLNTARVKPGESVAVIGCGGVGLSAIQGARLAGARHIIAIDRVAASLDLAISLGATHVVDPATADVVVSVREIADGVGVDHAIEAVGSVSTAELAFSLTRRGGTATVVGLVPSGSSISIPSDELFYERRIQGSAMGSNDFKVDTPRYIQMYQDGRLRIDDLVAENIGLEDINAGFDRMREAGTGRSVIVFPI